MNNMFIESKSKYGFDETVEKLNEAIAQGGWRVLHTHNLQETMIKNGYNDVLQTKVIELCNPQLAHKLLSDDSMRIYSNMMPCRMSVYEQADGFTYVSRMNTKMLSMQIGGKVEEVMGGAFTMAEEFVNKVSE